jgi:hypothetical protein
MTKVFWLLVFINSHLITWAQQKNHRIEETDRKVEFYLDKSIVAKTTGTTDPEGEKSISSFDNCKIVKIKTLDKGLEKKVRWFFDNDTLFYSDQVWTKISTFQVVDQQKFYLQNNRLQVWLNENNRAVNPNSSEFINFEAELRNYSEKLLKSINE